MTGNQVEKIERFIEEKMDPEERKNFEEELLADKDFFAVYKTYLVIAATMNTPQKSAGEKDVKTTLAALSDEYFPAAQKNKYPVSVEITVPGTAQKRYRTKIIQAAMLAAAVLGIIVMGTWYIVKDKKNAAHQPLTSAAAPSGLAGSGKKNPDTVLPDTGVSNRVKHDPEKNIHPEQLNSTLQKQLFAAYFKPDARPGDKEAFPEDAFDLYERRHYTEAVAAFTDAEPDLSTRGEETLPQEKFYIGYYKALSYMAIGKDAQAIRLLKNLAAPDSALQVKVAWYLALSYIRTGNIQKARSLLTEIHGNNSSPEYSEKANELMIKLNVRR